MTRICIVDDQRHTTLDMKAKVRAAGVPDEDIEVMWEPEGNTSGPPDGDLADVLDGLLARHTDNPAADCSLDGADVVLIDHRLENLHGPYQRLLNGSFLAELVRQHTDAKVIGTINQSAIHPYHLNFRRPADRSADVAVHEDDLSCPGMWGRDGEAIHNPWQMPDLVRRAEGADERIKRVAKGWKKPVYKLLGFKEDEQFLLPGEFNMVGLDFAHNTPEDIADAHVGLKERDDLPKVRLHGIAAAAIASWVQGPVIQPQDIFMDAPHVARICPRLVGGLAREQLQTTSSRRASSVLEKAPELKAHRVDLGPWTERPVWNARTLIEDQGIPDIGKPLSRPKHDWVFAENASQWFPRDHPQIAEFRADGYFETLYIYRDPKDERLARRKIIPQSRLA